MIFITRNRLDKLLVQTLQEALNRQLKTISEHPDDLQKLNQAIGSMEALFILRSKIERKNFI